MFPQEESRSAKGDSEESLRGCQLLLSTAAPVTVVAVSTQAMMCGVTFSKEKYKTSTFAEIRCGVFPHKALSYTVQ